MNRLLLSKKPIKKNKQNINKNQDNISQKLEEDLIKKSYITYINLEDRIDRRQKFERFYKNENFEPKRFNAIKTSKDNFTKKYPHLELSSYLNDLRNIKWINGTLGCYDSHYSILLDNLNNTEHDFLVVLEDDCTISTKSLNKCLNYLNNNKNIDILRINCWKDIPENPFKINFTNPHSKYVNNQSIYYDGGTHCCIFLIKNIPKVISYMNNEFVYQIDAIYSTNKINSVIYKIDEEIKYKSVSSIQKQGLDLKDKKDKILFQKLLLRK